MALVRQPKTAGFGLKSRYNIFVGRPSKCYLIIINYIPTLNFFEIIFS